MSDRIPGSSWSNPIWHGKWRIYVESSPFGNWAFCHDDYDGAEDANDNRHGWGKSVDDCKEFIAEMEASS